MRWLLLILLNSIGLRRVAQLWLQRAIAGLRPSSPRDLVERLPGAIEDTWPEPAERIRVYDTLLARTATFGADNLLHHIARFEILLDLFEHDRKRSIEMTPSTVSVLRRQLSPHEEIVQRAMQQHAIALKVSGDPIGALQIEEDLLATALADEPPDSPRGFSLRHNIAMSYKMSGNPTGCTERLEALLRDISAHLPDEHISFERTAAFYFDHLCDLGRDDARAFIQGLIDEHAQASPSHA
jgi:hypothetical protein